MTVSNGVKIKHSSSTWIACSSTASMHGDRMTIAFCDNFDEPTPSIVLEDSNYGITAAKAAGVYVIGYRGNLVEGYKQTGADAYADTMAEVENLVGSRQTM